MSRTHNNLNVTVVQLMSIFCLKKIQVKEEKMISKSSWLLFEFSHVPTMVDEGCLVMAC